MLWLADRAVQLVVDCLVNVDVVLTIHCPSSEEDHVVSAQAVHRVPLVSAGFYFYYIQARESPGNCRMRTVVFFREEQEQDLTKIASEVVATTISKSRRSRDLGISEILRR